MASHKEFDWKDGDNGRLERNIDEAEQFYTTLARRFEGTGRIFFAMTAHVSFSVPRTTHSLAPINALKNAWLQVRYDHPTIASWVEFDSKSSKCKKIYEPITDIHDQRCAEWLDKTFQIISNGQTGQEWCNSDPPVPKLPTLFLITRPSSSDTYTADVVLRSQHDVVDGIGSLHLLNNLFHHASLFLDQPDRQLPNFGDEAKNLSPPLRVAASIPDTLQPVQQTRLDEIYEKNSLLRGDSEIAELPFRRGPKTPQRHQRVELNMSLKESEDILNAIKSIGVSVTHVYHAAIALTLRKLQERTSGERKVRYINYALINERPLCRHPYNTSKHPAAVYHSVSGLSLVIDLDVPSSTTEQGTASSNLTKQQFLHVVEDVSRYYTTIRDDKEHIALAPSYWSKATPPYPVGDNPPPVPQPNEQPSVSISSLGVIDKIISPKHGEFELESPWVTGEELGTGLGLFLGTFRGSMCLSAAYNDAWHDESKVSKFLQDCNDLVVHYLL
ncbi:hypothetical protein N7462_008384 [Penicillium macrosclerotiorum]|uniref:uncharacterized protein n=1 Tax=Penicillium macrosclerotiorum TaxID=303699 RepID=UPI002549B58D|nr:uncharacterized protein N7462_008384 [Penicillium macrosclerotiorum]KAJ5675487.1 hypothetical protein N7462_008384 [Penicillium macrosclerotiorum]